VRRKAELVTAVAGWLLTIEDACKRYRLTIEEFLGWQRAIRRNGMPGLRATRVQHYRTYPASPKKPGPRGHSSALPAE
jgi:hypothetical protein